MRLIDADNTKKFVDVLYNCDGRADIIKRIIDQQPTAFDKKKVIEELRYISSLGKIPDQDSAGYGEGYLDERVIPLRGAIKIVKEGGIDG